MKFALLFVLTSVINPILAQQNISYKKYSPAALRTDVAFLKQQVFNVHANPYSELTHSNYEKVFDSINGAIKDSLNLIQFFKLIKPAVSYLSDEHSAITLPEKQSYVLNGNAVFLPFAIKKAGNSFVVDTVFENNTELKSGDVILSVNQMSISQAIANCERYTTGFPNQRKEKAIKQFGYLIALAYPFENNFRIKKQNGQEILLNGITEKSWLDYINKVNGEDQVCEQSISYTKYKDYGIINACSFNVTKIKSLEYFEKVIDSIFTKIKIDNNKALIIDVSKNSGGNSAVGDLLINHFYDKPYKKYQCNWKRSDEYLSLMKSWGFENEQYQKIKVGEILHYNSETIEPVKKNNLFTGSVYVLVGRGTFSSAIQFATVVKDNSIAKIIGQEPENGHPNHFGEMYSTELPNTRINVRFGVKQWIRPSGKLTENRLVPDIILNRSDAIEEISKGYLKNL